jgi:hypothetical protein
LSYSRRHLWPAYKRILQSSSLPIFAGPFRGEVGFEALYWIPFLRRLMKSCAIDPARVIPITRGGAAAWYGTPTGIELYEMRSPQDVRVENAVQHAKYHQLKQTHWTPFDRAVVKDAARTIGVSRYLTIHPAWMFARLGPYFSSQMGLHDLEQEALFDPLTVPMLPEGATLPDKFVAVRFYLRHTYPGHPPLVAFAKESIKQIASQTPVVLLNSGVHADEHIDLACTHPNVIPLSDVCPITPANNLAVQSAVLARALGFVGTYGGLAQLALRLGKPSVSYYHEWGGTALAHKHLADAIALNRNIPCQVHRVGELPLLQNVMPLMEAVSA